MPVKHYFSPFVFILLILFSACSQQSTKIYTIKGEKDLIPEGIAVDKDKIFLSSILKNKIICFDLKNGTVTDFIKTGAYNFKSGVGLFAKDNLLFALTNSSLSGSSKPSLFIFNISEQKLIRTYLLNDNKDHLWNDLTVNKFNQVFITDTRQHSIYKINYPQDEIEKYYTDSTILYPNGIDISGDGKKLFIASGKYGIRILDIATKKILNPISKTTAGIDGLKFYKNHLYGVRNIDLDHTKHSLLAIHLNNQLDNIDTVKQLLVKNDLMNVPTTIAIKNGYIYLLANSQLDNLNQNNLQIINREALTDTYILKIKIKS